MMTKTAGQVVYKLAMGVLHTTLSVVIQSEVKDLTESNREIPRAARNDKIKDGLSWNGKPGMAL
jgi:hypothetical protein